MGVSGIESGAQAWVLFFVGSYVIGHLVFLIGSFLDRLYDPVRKLLMTEDRDRLFKAATAIRRSVLGEYGKTLNNFQFAKSVLQLRYDTPSTEIARLEADSKFFRSLSVVLVVCAIFWAHALDPGGWLVWFVLLMLCIWRYAERRWKSTQVAFAFLVAHETSRRNETSGRAKDIGEANI